MAAYTGSFSKGKVAEKHLDRTEYIRKDGKLNAKGLKYHKEGKIDFRRTKYNKVLRNQSIYDAYDEVFSAALEKYNQKVSRPCRRINDYVQHCRDSKTVNDAYEYVVQVGGLDSGQPGNLDKFYTEFLRRFEHRFGGSFKVYKAAIHNDETTPHMHMEMFPHAKSKSNRGLEVKNSFQDAVKECGFSNEVEFISYIQGEFMTEVMHDFGIERKEGNSKGRDRLELPEFKQQKEEMRKLESINDKLYKLNEDIIDEIEKLEPQRDALRDEIDLTAEWKALCNAYHSTLDEVWYLENEPEAYQRHQEAKTKAIKQVEQKTKQVQQQRIKSDRLEIQQDTQDPYLGISY